MKILIMNRLPLDTRPYAQWLGPHHRTVLLTDAAAVAADPGRRTAQLGSYEQVVELEPFHDNVLVEREILRLHERYRFDRIVTVSEFDLLRAARLREMLGIAGQDVTSATAYRDKLTMKRLLRQAGIPVVAFQAAPDLTSLLRFTHEHGYPVVVKPRRGGASIGVRVLRSEAELMDYARRTPGFGADHPAPLLVEAYLEHELVHVDGIVVAGEPLLIWPSSQGSTSCLGMLSGESLRSTLLDAEDPLVEPTRQLTLRALAALPTPPISLFHAEIFVTADRGPILNEIACRLPGGRIDEQIELGFGVDMVETYVKAVAGEPLPAIDRVPRQIAGLVLFPPRPGRLIGVAGRCPIPGVRRYRANAAAGTVLNAAVRSIDEIASALAVGGTRVEVEAILHEVTDWFDRTVVIQPGSDNPPAPLRRTVARRETTVARPESAAAPPEYTYRVRRRYPHDTAAFTQGIVYDGDLFYESVGRYGKSELRKVEVATGKVVMRSPIEDAFWAEGIAVQGDRIYQLTWRERRVFVYRKDDLARIASFEIDSEGWGLAAAPGAGLVMSDGTDQLYRLIPDSPAPQPLVRVTSNGTPVKLLNELQMVDGELYANTWYSERIARIDPHTGAVVGWIDLTGLNPCSAEQWRDGAVLNGIAHDAAGQRIFVTGKLWPSVYEIEVVPRPCPADTDSGRTDNGRTDSGPGNGGRRQRLGVSRR